MSKKLPLNTTPSSFENAMTELSELVTQMEAGDLALEASVSAYQRGSELIKYCAAQLDKVEQQVKILDAGLLKPFSADDANEVNA
ncbi:exodeoxyribonuclease VII small subunit [Undibacterium piscinae]|jgi:exodeoxyribonuclease VII small subunit|uniref:Exodeoxyribonuclease 7 small subunit n=1 Tax=Undibacterium piscinae TaxID=2495591 RepID=A0A6M4A6Y7_9BURK|nr:exodeoxyribonuclease VII small subunit [Undibacterium piscinae]